jgi:hypothetical protein
VELANTSARSLLGPFKVRLISLDSDVAAVEAAGTSNGLTAAGAVWDLTSSVDHGRLPPGARSRPLILAFKLSDVRPFIQGHEDRFDYRLVTFFVRVLGHAAN